MTTQTKGHTPGPWICDQINGEIHTGEEECISRVYLLAEQESANARLIAAAPDLLAACKRSLEDLESLLEHGCGDETCMRASIATLRGDITKAEGGAT